MAISTRSGTGNYSPLLGQNPIGQELVKDYGVPEELMIDRSKEQKSRMQKARLSIRHA